MHVSNIVPDLADPVLLTSALTVKDVEGFKGEVVSLPLTFNQLVLEFCPIDTATFGKLLLIVTAVPAFTNAIGDVIVPIVAVAGPAPDITAVAVSS